MFKKKSKRVKNIGKVIFKEKMDKHYPELEKKSKRKGKFLQKKCPFDW